MRPLPQPPSPCRRQARRRRDLAILHSAADLRGGDLDRDHAGGGGERLLAADLALSPDLTADRAGVLLLSRRQRLRRDRHHRGSDRAAGQRRGSPALYAVAGGQRRLLRAHAHLRGRRRRESGARPDAEPGAAGDAAPAPGRAEAGREHQEAVPRHPHDRRSRLTGRPLRRRIHEQLCHAPAPRRAAAVSGRRRHPAARSTRLFAADLARPRAAHHARAHAAERSQRDRRAERAGDRRRERPVAGRCRSAARTGRRGHGPAGHARAIRQHGARLRCDRAGHAADTAARCRPRRTGGRRL